MEKLMTTTVPCTSYSHAAAQMAYWQAKGNVTSIPLFDGWGWYITVTPLMEYMEAHK